MARHVETVRGKYENLSLLAPVKLTNGFVTADSLLGCPCFCKFCLNRRYPLWQRFFEKKKIFPNSLTVEQALSIFQRTKCITEARMTVKVGADTDQSCEEEFSHGLVEGMPTDYPIVFMRRRAISPVYRQWYSQKRDNLLVQVTLTPRSRYMDVTGDPFAVLESCQGINANLFFVVGPLCPDNMGEGRELIMALPPGTRLWIKELIVRDIPTLAVQKQNEINRGQAENLRLLARERGLHVIHYLNCVVRSGLGLGFHKRGEFVSEPNQWQLDWAESWCPSKEICDNAAADDEQAIAKIRDCLAAMRLHPESSIQKFGYHSYLVRVKEDVAFGDEAYLREMTGLKVDLNKKGRKTGTVLSEDIIARWRETDFFPIDEVMELAEESYRIAFGD